VQSIATARDVGCTKELTRTHGKQGKLAALYHYLARPSQCRILRTDMKETAALELINM
jgi:hypothetical protein